MTPTDYYHQPNAPKANSLVPGASAIVGDNEARILPSAEKTGVAGVAYDDREVRQ